MGRVRWSAPQNLTRKILIAGIVPRNVTLAIYKPSEAPTLWQALVIRTTLQTGARGMKPSQPEDVGAGSNAQAQSDALGKTQQQDQLNPFAATSASSPDAGPPRTKPRTNWAAASLVLGITPLCILFPYYTGNLSARSRQPSGVEVVFFGEPRFSVIIVFLLFCGALFIASSAFVCGAFVTKKDLIGENQVGPFVKVMAIAGMFMGSCMSILTLLAMLGFLLMFFAASMR